MNDEQNTTMTICGHFPIIPINGTVRCDVSPVSKRHQERPPSKDLPHDSAPLCTGRREGKALYYFEVGW